MATTNLDAELAVLKNLDGRRAGSGESEPMYRALAETLQRVVGHQLCTLLVFDQRTYEAERVFSDNPRAYPVGGRKRLARTPWGGQVIEGRSCWLGRTPDDIKWAFADHELIASLGLGSGINWVVVEGDRLLGTVNVFHAEGHYGPEHLEMGKPLAALLAPAYTTHIGGPETEPQTNGGENG